MLLLLIDGDPNRKQREHNGVVYAIIQKALHDLFDEVTGLYPKSANPTCHSGT
jgi:hypothetical protein